MNLTAIAGSLEAAISLPTLMQRTKIGSEPQSIVPCSSSAGGKLWMVFQLSWMSLYTVQRKGQQKVKVEGDEA
jgi:hypothetical protein